MIAQEALVGTSLSGLVGISVCVSRYLRYESARSGREPNFSAKSIVEPAGPLLIHPGLPGRSS